MDKQTIVEACENVLGQHDKEYSHREINDLVQRWYDEKYGLIELLRKHPNWNEDAMAVVFDYDTCREIDNGAYSVSCGRICAAFRRYCDEKKAEAMPVVTPVSVDECKGILDTLDLVGRMSGGRLFCVNEVFCLEEELILNCASGSGKAVLSDNAGWVMIDRRSLPIILLDEASRLALQGVRKDALFTIDINGVAITDPAMALKEITRVSNSQIVTDDIKTVYDRYGLKCSVGQRTSRALNAAFKAFGVPAIMDDYERTFGTIADAINPLAITRHTILSVHPCDYLHMSYGYRWHSCHNIDEGCYMAGTLSYMCDGSSMIFYTVDRAFDGDDYYREERINRQVYAFENNVLIQSRLYPDYTDDLNRTNFRNAVQSIFATCLDVPNLWTLKTHCGSVHDLICTCDESLHYPDYDYDEYRATASLLQNAETGIVHIGSRCYCIECGDQLYEQGSLHCDDCGVRGIVCACCGDRYDEEDMHLINGEWYCEDCCSWCDECEEWTTEEVSYVTVDGYGRYVCESCLDGLYHCDGCDEWFSDATTTASDTGAEYCPRCLESNCVLCEDCEDWFEGALIAIDGGNKYVCESCADDSYYKCDECGDWVSDDTVEIGGKQLCAVCASMVEPDDDEESDESEEVA